MEMSIANPTVNWPPPETSTKSGAFQASQTSLAVVSNSRQLDLNLFTKEGDKVTISLDARSAAMYAQFQQAQGGVDDDGAYVQYGKGELSASLYEREMTFSVEGDLNAEERREIGIVLKTLDKMMHKFVNGRMKPMITKASKLMGLDTIAGLEAKMSYERTTLVAQQSQMNSVYNQRGENEPAAQTSHGPQPLQIPQSVEAAETLLFSEADSVADKMARHIRSAQTPMERLLKFVDKLMNDYRKQAAEMAPKGPRMIDHISDRINDRLQQTLKRKRDTPDGDSLRR